MDGELLAGRFEAERTRLQAVAYRLLGSASEADDAVQETWLRLNRSDATEIENLGGWLTTVTARVCLNKLRSRRTRPEEPFDAHVPDPIVSPESAADPEQQAVLADSVGLALLVVLDTLAPAERLAFVLHDMFAVPFEDIATVIDRTPAATRQLASRARRRVQGVAPAPDADLARQREVVDAFLAAARGGDFDALVAVLDPDVVLRADDGPDTSVLVRGAETVAGRAMTFARPEAVVRRVLVNGAPGLVAAPGGLPVAVMAFSVVDGRIVAINVLTDGDRLENLDLSVIED